MTLVALGAALFFIIGTGLPLLSYDHWAVRLFDFPRVQIVVGGSATLAVLLLLGPASFLEYSVAALLAGCLVYQIDHILPYTVLSAQQVQAAVPSDRAERLSLLICNVEIDNRNPEPFLKCIARWEPDLVLALETDDWWAEQLREVEEAYPYTVKQPQDNAYGMLLYSKRPLHDVEVRFLVEDHVPSIHARVSLTGGTAAYLHGMHPRPPHPTHRPDTTERDAELLHLARSIQDRDAPTIVAGDLNDVSWSYTTRLFQKLSGLLDPRIGRGTYSTFHARYPIFRYPLDHTFHSSHFKLVDLQVLPYVGSDHFPVYAELQYEREASDEQMEPTADAADEAQAQHELDKLQRKKNDRQSPPADRTADASPESDPAN